MEMQKFIEVNWPAQQSLHHLVTEVGLEVRFSISQTVFFQHTVILILSMTELGPKSKDVKLSD